ncbi:MAG TPA: OB-fold nucleic acid binding domain-containing protein [Candidatus Limnocylindrales bacterium]|nr:OB-fold nucleic acid binding domain-containing protein [Candidatus Limnocylindrales bacterium]
MITDGQSSAPDVDLAGLGAMVGRMVRVGGLVASLDGASFVLDDGTGRVRVTLQGTASEYGALIEPGDALSLEGRVARSASAPTGEVPFVILVDDPASIAQAGDPGAASAPLIEPPAPGEGALVEPRVADAGGLGTLVPSTAAGVGTLGLVALLSVLVTMVRRRRAHARLARRVGARLVAVSAPRSAPTGPPDGHSGPVS